jgi:8-oxo-dGTP pyrophosphatase MutT (NUDIX family)
VNEVRQTVPQKSEAPRDQAAALGYVEGGRGLRYVLVTSRRTQRWIFPKGAVDAGESAAAAAARELEEEAGALGEARGRPLGQYTSLKLVGDVFVPLKVVLYPVRVRRLLDTWPERGERTRHLAPAGEVCNLLADPGMAELLVAFERAHRPRIS